VNDRQEHSLQVIRALPDVPPDARIEEDRQGVVYVYGAHEYTIQEDGSAGSSGESALIFLQRCAETDSRVADLPPVQFTPKEVPSDKTFSDDPLDVDKAVRILSAQGLPAEKAFEVATDLKQRVQAQMDAKPPAQMPTVDDEPEPEGGRE